MRSFLYPSSVSKSARGLPTALSLACAMGVLSCSFTLDFDEQQCTTNSDCRSRGDAFENSECVDGVCEAGPECRQDEDCAGEPCVKGRCVDRWACLDDQPSPAREAIVRMVPVSTIFGDPLPRVPVLVCNIVDTECTAPVASLMTDDSGILTLELEPDFTGYLETKLDMFFPQMDFLPTLIADETSIVPITLSPAPVIAGLAQAVGAAPDPERGHIVMSSWSCLGEAPNVVLEAPRADAQTIPYYVLNGVPSADLEATTEDGSGGYLNFQPGNATVNINTKNGDRLMTLSVVVRRSTISIIHVQPIADGVGTEAMNASPSRE
jgi:hypothetical protein